MLKPKQGHERIARELMEKIFTRELKDGEKLPTEKELSSAMGIDRTTLRVALKQLESMQLLEIRQGDGIYVRDYMKFAGIDFLSKLIMLHEGEQGGLVMEEYLIDEVWGFWTMLFPEFLKMAVPKMSPRHLTHLVDLLMEEKNAIHDKERLIEYELQEQDVVAEVINNLVLVLLFNSSRPLRKKMLEIFVSNTNPAELGRHVEAKIALLRAYGNGSSEDVVAAFDTFRNLLVSYHQNIKKILTARKWESAGRG